MATNKTENTTLVSIVLCTYNGSRFVGEQLKSILEQSYSNLEIIISDDASTDETYVLLEKIAASDNRIQLYRNAVNAGYAANFSSACLRATGDYIAIADQDDIWHRDKINHLINQWKPGVPLMYCNSVRFLDGAAALDAKPNPHYRRFEGTDCRKLALFNTISGHALIVKKDFLPLILPFPENVLYDWWAGVVAACNGGVGYVPEILVFQRVHSSNVSMHMSSDHNDKRYKNVFNERIKNHLRQFILAPNLTRGQDEFFSTLSALWNDGMNRKFSLKLCLFLVANRKIIFNYKQKKFAFFSHVKHSIRLATN